MGISKCDPLVFSIEDGCDHLFQAGLLALGSSYSPRLPVKYDSGFLGSIKILCGFRPPIQRRDRSRFSRDSLFKFGETPNLPEQVMSNSARLYQYSSYECKSKKCWISQGLTFAGARTGSSWSKKTKATTAMRTLAAERINMAG